MKIRRFEAADAPALDRLNERLRAGGAHERVDPEGSEQQHSTIIRQRLFVASDDGEIRGAVWLKEHAFRVRGGDLRGKARSGACG